MADLPQNFSFTEVHEWINTTADAATAGATVKVGITDVAAERLGEVVYADLPAVGDTLTHSEPCGEVESTKSVSDVYAPVSGTVTAVNEALEDDYSVINNDSYGEGWLFEIEISEAGPLLDADGYAASAGLN